jgi:predicted MFS family arabinose efflux permease
MNRSVAASPCEISILHATLAGLCAVLVGIGLARFAYTPLIPALIDAQWFTAAEAAYLGAANLAGYLAGALSARAMARAGSAPFVLRAMMLLATATFFASALPLSFAWFFVWRFASGFAGGVLMVLAAPTVLPHVPPARRGLAGGAIFTGVGLGIAASGTLVPFLLDLGLALTWCGLGVLALLLTVLAWPGWPRDGAAPAGPAVVARGGARLRALYVEYGLNAFGLVPHMVFLVVFIAHGLGQGLDVGAACWVLFGVGAALGPMLAGYLADRIGFAWALRLAFGLQAAAVALAVLPTGAWGLALSSLVAGAFLPGVVPLVLGRVHELAPPEQTGAAWSLATIAFALGQAAGAYGLSWLFARSSDYSLLFELGAAAILLALLIDLAFARR